MTLRDSEVGGSWNDRAEGFSVPMVCVGDDNEGEDMEVMEWYLGGGSLI